MNSELLDILVCPVCKGKIEYDKDHQEIICRFDKLAYPIQQGVPVMLEDQARSIVL